MKQLHSYIFAILCLLGLDSAFALDFPYSEWSLANYEGAYATSNEGFVSVADGGSDYWHVQLTRSNIELQAGKTYEVKFYLQGVSARRYVEVRIGRDGFPYDAFAEFGEVAATVNGRTVTKTFTMQSGNVSNARFEFNLGKNSGTVYLSDVSLNCLDCGSNQNIGGNNSYATSASDWGYVVVADMVDFRDYSMSLGDVFGQSLELGADSKIYGNVDASGHCFLRERANISGDLHYTNQCEEQNGVVAKTKSAATLSKPVVGIPNIVAGISPVSVGIDETITLLPGNYGVFYANARSKVHLSSGSYTFQNIFTEPEAEFAFDLTSGPITINVLGNVRFGDRNTFSITGGNPSEILWNVAGENVDMGTDGLYFGKFVAPSAFVRIPSRSHLVGAVYANKFQIEPQSTVSQEPRATEISHSEEHFGPFFESGVFRYVSQLPLSASAIEMFVYADNAQFKVNGETSTTVELPSSNVTASISLTRNMISGFPAEAFSSSYVFNFTKSANYRIYWNPQTQCKQGCDGTTAATAVGDFATVLETAKATGREINMAGGVWNVTDNFTDGVVPWKVGFELVGYKGDIWDLNSEKELPLLNMGGNTHVEIEGRSPRSIVGLRLENGFNAENGGTIHSDNQKLLLKNIVIAKSKSNKNGGALATSDSLYLETAHFTQNTSKGNGGAISAQGEISMLNVIYLNNTTALNGGAVNLLGGNTYIGNAIFYDNHAADNGGAINNDGATLNIWNATFFANVATTKNGAISGKAKGSIGNSIFWKNTTATCTGECAEEVIVGYNATNSSFSKNYAGTNIYIGDPKFANENNPAGENEYMNYDAGINLDQKSNLLKAGVKNNFAPQYDIVDMEREEDAIALGPYANAMPSKNVTFGVLDEDGNVIAHKPAIPLISAVMGAYHRNYLRHSPYARVWKATIDRNKKTKKLKKARVKLWVKDKDGNKRTKDPIVEFDVFRNGDENGQCVFQTMTKNEGKPILFSKRLKDAGEYDEAIVIYMGAVTDYFYYEAKEK